MPYLKNGWTSENHEEWLCTRCPRRLVKITNPKACMLWETKTDVSFFSGRKFTCGCVFEASMDEVNIKPDMRSTVIIDKLGDCYEFNQVQKSTRNNR